VLSLRVDPRTALQVAALCAWTSVDSLAMLTIGRARDGGGRFERAHSVKPMRIDCPGYRRRIPAGQLGRPECNALL
jgi:hypothetical protein